MMDTSPLEHDQEEGIEQRIASQQQKIDAAGATIGSSCTNSTSLVLVDAPPPAGGTVRGGEGDANSMARSLFLLGGGKRHSGDIDNAGTTTRNAGTSKRPKMVIGRGTGGGGGSSSSSLSSPMRGLLSEDQQQQQFTPTPMNPTLLQMTEESSMLRRMPPQLQFNDGLVLGGGYIGTNSADSARAHQMQINLIQQQQQALLASKLAQQQQQQFQQRAMSTQQLQSQQLNSNFSPTSFDVRLLSSQGPNFFLGGHGTSGMNASLLGTGGSAGILLQNLRGMVGIGGDSISGDQSKFMLQHQLGIFGGAAGTNLAGNSARGDYGSNKNNDTSMASLSMASASGRQLLLMQQALARGIGGPPAGMPAQQQHQGHFLGGSMQGFSMADHIHLGQQQGFMDSTTNMVLPTSSSSITVGNDFRDPQAMTSGERTGSSMTPAGISHQALYARDAPEEVGSSGEKRSVLYMTCDDDSLSAYQCLVRKQIQLFDANEDDVESNAQGRNKAIILGQVGIRCRHCAKIPPRHRTRGATYYPAKLHGLYQAAQNMASAHLGKNCQLISDVLRQELIILRERKSSAGGGKQYWAHGVRVLGVVEINNVLRFAGDDEIHPGDDGETAVADSINDTDTSNATQEKTPASEKNNGDEKKKIQVNTAPQHHPVDKN